MAQSQVLDGSAEHYFHLSSALWGKHDDDQPLVAALIVSALTNEDGVNDVIPERHRIVIKYSPFATDLGALPDAVQGVIKTLVTECSDWNAFPFLEKGKFPVVIGSDDPVSPSTGSASTAVELSAPTFRRLYEFNPMVELPGDGAEFDKEWFVRLVAPLKRRLEGLAGVSRVHVARCQITVDCDVDLDLVLLDQLVELTLNSFSVLTPEVFQSYKKSSLPVEPRVTPIGIPDEDAK